MQGMLLKCVCDGRVLTFQKGNIVNVHLLFQQSGGCKYLTKTANVKHVDENSIGVEFHQPDSELVDFIKPCRVDSDDNAGTISAGITASATAGPDMHNATNADFLNKAPGITPATDTREPSMSTGKERRMFFAGLSLMIIAAGLALGAWQYTSHINTRISALETVTEKHSSELAEVQEWALPASMIEGKFAYLNAQMKALIDSFVKLENRLTTDSAPPPVKIVAQADTLAAETGNGATTTGPAIMETVDTPVTTSAKATDDSVQKSSPTMAPVTPAAPETQATTQPEIPAVPAGTAPGPWVINLASSPYKTAADQFAAKARTKDIPVELVKAEVKGRDYWRVQLTGFPSKAAARTYAGPTKEKLGLKDVWIFRQ
jgi:hypothetical protein